MASYNSITLVGRLTRDPDMKFTPSGKQVANFSLAVDRRGKAGSEKETDFIPIVAWERTAEICGQYLTKGSLILIEGRLQVRKYEVDGQKRTAFDVVANNMQMLGGKTDNGEGKPAAAQQHEAEDMGIEDIPF